MGTVRTEYIHFCPIDDEATLEAIVAHIELQIKIESQISVQFSSLEEEW